MLYDLQYWNVSDITPKYHGGPGYVVSQPAVEVNNRILDTPVSVLHIPLMNLLNFVVISNLVDFALVR